MSFERFFISPESEVPKRSATLATGFRELVSSRALAYPVFHNLEDALSEEGFKLADVISVAEVLQNNSLLCRSENFSRIMDLLLEKQPVLIANRGEANMCIMASGEGFRVAMEEGFSGEDVGNAVKAVMTFRGSHLSSRDSVSRDAELWQTKPKTAQVSLIGEGEVALDDIVMISFRFPSHLFPEELLTDEETERLESGEKVPFIVRHYTPHIEKATH